MLYPIEAYSSWLLSFNSNIVNKNQTKLIQKNNITNNKTMMKKMFILLVLLTTTIRFVQAKQTTDYTTENDTNFVEHPPRKMEVVTSTIAEDPLYAKQQKPSTPWYIGVSSGLSYGRTTFASFAMDETNPGFNANMLGGYKINKLLSVEVSLDYTHMKLGAYDCCQNLWLGSDGNRYFAPLSGVDSYKYSNLTSTSNLVGLGTHLNIDLLSFWNRYPKWSKWAKWPMCLSGRHLFLLQFTEYIAKQT